jgi:hypothetical protein
MLRKTKTSKINNKQLNEAGGTFFLLPFLMLAIMDKNEGCGNRCQEEQENRVKALSK